MLDKIPLALIVQGSHPAWITSAVGMTFPVMNRRGLRVSEAIAARAVL
jgi:hypothetical protein